MARAVPRKVRRQCWGQVLGTGRATRPSRVARIQASREDWDALLALTTARPYALPDSFATYAAELGLAPGNPDSALFGPAGRTPTLRFGSQIPSVSRSGVAFAFGATTTQREVARVTAT